MNNVKAPYNVNKLTSDAAVNALKNTDLLEKNVREVLDQRDAVKKELEGLDFVVKVYPSDANFLLFRVKQKANELYKTVSIRSCVHCTSRILIHGSYIYIDLMQYGLISQCPSLIQNTDG